MVRSLKDTCIWCIARNLDKLNSIGKYLPNINKEQVLEWSVNHDMLSQAYLPFITYNLFSTTLKRLAFCDSSQVSDEILKQISASGCKLKEITIKKCHNVTDVGIQAITQNQTELEVLELIRLSSITGGAFECLQSNVLEKVDLSMCVNVDAKGMMRLVSVTCPSIKVLILAHCIKVDDPSPSIPFIANFLGEKLEELDVSDIHNINDESLVALAECCPNLRKLHLAGVNKITGFGLNKVFSSCTKLCDVDLSYCFSLSETLQFQSLINLPQTISSLSLIGIRMNNKELFVDALKRLERLEAIQLCGFSALNDDSLTKVLEAVGNHLNFLDLSGSVTSQLTDEGLKAVAQHCTQLSTLVLTLLPNATGITLMPMLTNVERAAQITALHFGARQMQYDVLLSAAQHCHNLESYSLSGLTDVDDDLILTLAQNCPQLKHLGLKRCSQVTDRSICELARCCSLNKLVISGCHLLTDKSIFSLANSCLGLEEIIMDGCSQISPVAVTYLKDCCVPRVLVKHKTPNVDPNQLMAKNLDTGQFCRVDNMFS